MVLRSTKKNIPLYKIIETELLEKINNDVYKVNSSIPTESELAHAYKTSRVTVRQATGNLVAKGILIRIRGSGTFVSRKTRTLERAVKIMGFNEEMREMGRAPSTEILNFEVVPAEKSIAEKLKITEEEPVYIVSRLRRADDKPIVLETSYMSVAKYPDLTYEVMKNSKYDYIEKTRNLEIDYCNQVVVPVIPSPICAQLLEIDDREPILKIMNTTYLKDGDVLDYTELVLNSSLCAYVAVKNRH